MRHCLIAVMLLLMLSAPAGRAAEWYDPDDWFDEDKAAARFEWWPNGVQMEDGSPDGRYDIDGYDADRSPLMEQDWGYGYDYNTVDWHEYNDPFTRWYQRNNGGWY